MDPNLQKTADMMQAMAKGLDEILNNDFSNRKNGFVLLVFPFDAPPGARTNYVSNAADRNEIITLLKEVISRFENSPTEGET